MGGKFLALMTATAFVATVPAQAENGTQPPKKAKDPNEVVCEKIEVLGSRVSVKRVCMTRSEWAERRLVDRQEIERAQTSRGMKGE